MNPLYREWGISVLVRVLGMGGAALIARGVITQAQFDAVDMAALAGVLFSLGYGVWKTYKTRQKVTTALANPDIVTEHQLEKVIKEGGASPASTPKTVVPMPVTPPPQA